MRKTTRIVPLLLILALVSACATTGTGDPVVVRAEDALTNGLTFYAAAMDYHFANSTRESPAVYKAFESFREKFPILWRAVDNAKREYQLNRGEGAATLDLKLTALAKLISDVTPYLTGGL
jgi:hypothetical protein